MVGCKAVEDEVPGGVYLCQVSESVSCGACCGLYNVQDARLESLEEMLAWRTDQFQHTARDVDGILAFKEKVTSREVQERPFPGFHHCPYIGLIGEREMRVGCLLHPLARGNRGVDWRGLSFYGGMACRVYFCPSCHELSPDWKEIVVQTAPHWHLYGLVVTESEMLANFFSHVEKKIRRPVTAGDIGENDRAVEALWDFLSLKLEWPYRDRTIPVWGNYFFHDAMYAHPTIDYEKFGGAPSPYDAILRASRSRFDSFKDLQQAECMIDGIIEKLAGSIACAPSG